MKAILLDSDGQRLAVAVPDDNSRVVVCADFSQVDEDEQSDALGAVGWFANHYRDHGFGTGSVTVSTNGLVFDFNDMNEAVGAKAAIDFCERKLGYDPKRGPVWLILGTVQGRDRSFLH